MKRTKMMTQEMKRNFKKTGSQEDVENPVVVAKFFNPYGRNTWFATEYDEETRTFFGYCVGPFDPDCDEWGYFSLDEIEAVMVPVFGTRLPLERDLYFSMVPMSKACPEAFDKLGREVPSIS